MSRSAQKAQKPTGTGFRAGLRRLLSNFFLPSGLGAASARTRPDQAQVMASAPPRRRTLLSPPRDFIHRRRFRRRLTNFIFIPLLSVIVAYAITRPTGGAGFTLPKAVQQASLTGPSNQQSEVLTTAISSRNSPAGGSIASSYSTAICGICCGPDTDWRLHAGRRAPCRRRGAGHRSS